MFELLKLYLVIFFVLFLPGYFLLVAIKREKIKFNLETLIFSLALSVFLVNFLVMLLNKINLALNFSSITIALLVLLGTLFFSTRKKLSWPKIEFKKINRYNWLFLLILIFAVFLRLDFFSERLVPRSTDLGHHMYWSNYIVQFGQLPEYNMPDFIIGEHIIFGIISILSGLSVISSMPLIILFLINIFSLLIIYLFVLKLSQTLWRKDAPIIALIAFLAIGVFYTASSPQANFVSGGVIGNVIGNLFIPLVLYSLIMGIIKNEKIYIFLFLILVWTLGYTHHLSSFILLYCLIGALFFSLIIFGIKIILKQLDLKTVWLFIKNRTKLFLNWPNIIILSLIIFWLLAIRLPSYLNSSAINIAVGDPSKDTRIGLNLNSLISATGAWRFLYSFLGLVFVSLFIFKEKRKSILIALGIINAWLVIIFLMSYQPDWLKIDIPSNRISSYLVYPASILSAIGVYWLLKIISKKYFQLILSSLFIIIFATGFVSGLSDFTFNRIVESNDQEVFQTFIAAQYLKKAIPDKKEKVLKDHNYLSGDTWIKIFFMQGYDYPLSRSLLKRYNDPVKPRETCTRDMISLPDSEIGKKCFSEYGVKYIMMKKNYDDDALLRSPNFSVIYTNNNVIIFQKK